MIFSSDLRLGPAGRGGGDSKLEYLWAWLWWFPSKSPHTSVMNFMAPQICSSPSLPRNWFMDSLIFCILCGYSCPFVERSLCFIFHMNPVGLILFVVRLCWILVWPDPRQCSLFTLRSYVTTIGYSLILLWSAVAEALVHVFCLNSGWSLGAQLYSIYCLFAGLRQYL